MEANKEILFESTQHYTWDAYRKICIELSKWVDIFAQLDKKHYQNVAILIFVSATLAISRMVQDYSSLPGWILWPERVVRWGSGVLLAACAFVECIRIFPKIESWIHHRAFLKSPLQDKTVNFSFYEGEMSVSCEDLSVEEIYPYGDLQLEQLPDDFVFHYFDFISQRAGMFFLNKENCSPGLLGFLGDLESRF
ncbi:MAG: hypothetical protein FWF59_07625 [Turicibacter sp.]|nr:hypothetical protein [Turicibacter sp.]